MNKCVGRILILYGDYLKNEEHFDMYTQIMVGYGSPLNKLFVDNMTIDWGTVNWNYLLAISSQNDVEYTLCNSILHDSNVELPQDIRRKIIEIQKYNELELSRYNILIRESHDLLESNNIKYAFIKTILPLPYAIHEVDILVNRIMPSWNILLEHNFCFDDNIPHDKFGPQGRFVLKSPYSMSIDLHKEISWLGQQYVDTYSVIRRRKRKDIQNFWVFIPSVEDELLTVIAHSLFQHHYLTFNDFFQICELLKNSNIDFSYMYAEAEKYGWGSALEVMLSCIISEYNALTVNYSSQQIKIPDFQSHQNSLNTFRIKSMDRAIFIPFFIVLQVYLKRLIRKNSKKDVLYSIRDNLFDIVATLYRSMRYAHKGTLAFNPIIPHIKKIIYNKSH